MVALETLTVAQLKAKKTELEAAICVYDNKQMAAKIFLNSYYGASGSPYFRFYDIDLAEAVTLTGQVIIQRIEQGINKFLNEIPGIVPDDFVIAADTDSVYLQMRQIVQKYVPSSDTAAMVDFLDRYSKESLEPLITQICAEIHDYFNCHTATLAMKRESIANKGIWTAKKRYALNVWDSEGVRYETPKLKITGLEAIKASTPAACRNKVKEAIQIIFNKDEDALIDFIAEFRAKFVTLPYDDIAFPRGVRELDKYSSKLSVYTKGTPIHVRGALLYNHFLKTNGLAKKIAPIEPGEKIKYCYLRCPNPMNNENVISCPNGLPKEFGLDKYIDYDTQFEKGFLAPVKALTDAIGWKTEHIVTLDILFA